QSRITDSGSRTADSAKGQSRVTDLDGGQIGSQIMELTPPGGKAWATLPRPSAGGKERDARVAIANRKEGEVHSPNENPPYGKIPDALTTWLLDLQSRDAWCKKKEWEAFPEGKVLKGPFEGRWHEDHASLVRCDGAVYVPEDRATRRQILHANHDDPWQGGHFGKKRTLEVVQRYYWWH